jgi:uncharacterized membrane protein
VPREFDAEVTEQHADERVTWRTDKGTHQAGVVTFHRLDTAHTRVTLQMEHEPSGVVEKAGDALGSVQHRIKGDMVRYPGDGINGIQPPLSATSSAAVWASTKAWERPVFGSMESKLW